MRDPDRGVGLVDVLAAGPAGAVRVDPQVVLVDLDRRLVGQERRDDDLRERGVAAVGAVERAQPHQPVHAALGLEEPVGVLALDGERRRLEAGLLARARLDELGLEAAILRPAEVHPQQHLRPVLGVGAARARVDRDDGVAGSYSPAKSASSCRRSSSLPDRLQLRLDSPARSGRAPAARPRRRARAAAARSARGASPGGSARSRLRSALPWSSQNRAPHLLLELGDAGAYGIRVKGNHEPRRAGL